MKPKKQQQKGQRRTVQNVSQGAGFRLHAAAHTLFQMPTQHQGQKKHPGNS